MSLRRELLGVGRATKFWGCDPATFWSGAGATRRKAAPATAQRRSTASNARPALVATAPLRNRPALPSPGVAGSANQA